MEDGNDGSLSEYSSDSAVRVAIDDASYRIGSGVVVAKQFKCERIYRVDMAREMLQEDGVNCGYGVKFKACWMPLFNDRKVSVA
jgi:hypothetical protein